MTPQEKAKVQIEYYTRILNGETYDQVNKDLQASIGSDEWKNLCGTRIDKQPCWFSTSYRWKPKTITVNGKEVPAPMQCHPEKEETYYFFNGISVERGLAINASSWDGFPIDLERYQYGIFQTKEQAEQYFNALIPKVRG